MKQEIIGVYHLHSYNRILTCELLSSLVNFKFMPLTVWDGIEQNCVDGLIIIEPELLVSSTTLKNLLKQIDSIKIPTLIISYTTLKLKSKRHNVFKFPNNPSIEELVLRVNNLFKNKE